MFDFVRLPNLIEQLEFNCIRLVFCSVLFDCIGRVYECSYKLNTFPFSKGNSTNCNAALRSIDKELLEIETALDVFEALVKREKKLLEQGEVHLYIH